MNCISSLLIHVVRRRYIFVLAYRVTESLYESYNITNHLTYSSVVKVRGCYLRPTILYCYAGQVRDYSINLNSYSPIGYWLSVIN